MIGLGFQIQTEVTLKNVALRTSNRKKSREFSQMRFIGSQLAIRGSFAGYSRGSECDRDCEQQMKRGSIASHESL